MTLTVTDGVANILLTQPNGTSNPFQSINIVDSEPNALVSAIFNISPAAHPGNEPGGAPYGSLTGPGIIATGTGHSVMFETGQVSLVELTQTLESTVYNAPDDLSGHLYVAAHITDSDNASADISDDIVQGTTGAVHIAGPTGGTITDGSTSHPFSGMTVTDADVGVGVVLTAVIGVNIGPDAELGAGGNYNLLGTLTANSPAQLTAELRHFSYKAPNPHSEAFSQFSVSVSDNVVGGGGETYVINDTNVAPTPPAPPPVVHPNPPTGTHWVDPLTPTGRIQFLGYPGSAGPQDALVDPAYYLASNPDVAAAGLNATQHYETYGWHEGRNPDALFDTAYYLTANPDVAASGMDPMLHYEEYGWKEGRNPSASFSTDQYLSANPDVALAGMDPLIHFEQYGSHEGRLIWHV
jgi:hypothetical protein